MGTGSVRAADDTIAFREAWGWAIVVKVYVAGQGPHDFVLDTASASTLIDPALAETLALSPTARTHLVTPAGRRPVGVAQADLRLGRAALREVEVLIADLPAVGPDERHVRGVLGQSALSRLEYTIDHERRRLVVHRVAEGVAGLFAPDQRPTLEARPGCGGAAGRYVLDSGVGMPVLFRQDRGLLERGPHRPVDVATHAGEAVWEEARLASLCVAGRRAESLRVVLRPTSLPERREDGLLPSRLFARVHVGLRAELLGVVHW
jgi:hypothetical protein